MEFMCNPRVNYIEPLISSLNQTIREYYEDQTQTHLDVLITFWLSNKLTVYSTPELFY